MGTPTQNSSQFARIDVPPSPFPRYIQIGKRFSVASESGEYEFLGPVIASPEAFYLIAEKSVNELSVETIGVVVGGALGGVVGGVIGGVGGKLLSSAWQTIESNRGPNLPFVCQASELHNAVRLDPDWPVKPRGNVFVVPRPAIERLTHTRFSYFSICGFLTITTFAVDFKVLPYVFSRGRIIRTLRAWRWAV